MRNLRLVLLVTSLVATLAVSTRVIANVMIWSFEATVRTTHFFDINANPIPGFSIPFNASVGDTISGYFKINLDDPGTLSFPGRADYNDQPAAFNVTINGTQLFVTTPGSGDISGITVFNDLPLDTVVFSRTSYDPRLLPTFFQFASIHFYGANTENPLNSVALPLDFSMGEFLREKVLEIGIRDRPFDRGYQLVANITATAITSVPEPASWALFGLGLGTLGLATYARRRWAPIC